MSKQSDLVSVSQGSGGDPLYIDATNDRVGIGTTSPSTLAHLKSSGDYAALTIETATTGGASYINLGDSNDLDVGQIAYYNSDDSLRMKVNASERMRIDSAGRVTMPYQPSFYSVLSSNWTYTGGGSRVIVPFNDVRFNVGGNFNTGTGKFTAPVSGKYLFTARLSTNSVATGDYFSVDFMKNNSNYSLGWNGDDGSNYRFVSASVVMDMAANDTAHVATEIANSTTIAGSSVRSFFAGYLIG